jgi:glycerol uptake facilitator protein
LSTPPERSPVPNWVVGEFLGTFLLVFFGCGSVAAAVLTGAQVGIYQVAIVWGLGITTAIYLTGSLSGAHLNPAVSASLASAGRLPPLLLPGYVAVQLLGAFAASAVLYAVFRGPLSAFEAANGLTRGASGSELSAMVFGEYFPSPAWHYHAAQGIVVVPESAAFLVESLGTAVLVLVILCVTDPRNRANPGVLTAAAVGLTITMLISLFGPLTMAGFNPARDLGPRLFSFFAGWGGLVFSHNGWGWLVVYVVGPFAGGQAGALIYKTFLRDRYAECASTQTPGGPA